MPKAPDSDAMRPEYDFSKGKRGRYAGRFFPVGPWDEGDRVVLKRAVPEQRLEEGDIGVVVHRHEGGGAFRVAFKLASGEIVAHLTLTTDDLRSLEPQEMLHARSRE